MADKMNNDIVIPSKNKVIDTESTTFKNRKRELSISESENEFNDHIDTYNCVTSTKGSLCMDSQLNAITKRTSKQSLTEVIQKLTRKIEHIEKKVAKNQNVIKNIIVDDVNYDDKLTYQPPNKIIKYDIEMISDDSCNSDENNIRSTDNLNTTRHVDKRIKIDKNIIFQTDVDYSEKDSKSLTNKEVEMLLELDDFDDEDSNAYFKTHDVQVNEEKCNRFVCKDNAIFFENDNNLENEFISNSDKLVLSQNNEEDSRSTNINDFENTLSPVDNMNSDRLTSQEKICFVSKNFPYESPRLEPETFQFNNNIYTSNKKIFDKKLIDSTGDNENMPSDYDKANTLQIIDNNASKISQSVSISDQAETLNTSNKHVFHETILDMKFDVSAKIQSMSEINNCSENSLNQSIEFVNVDEVLEAQAYEYDADNSCPESIDQDELLNLTKCENDQILLDHENNSTSIIKEGIHCTKPFDYLNSLIQTDAEETTQCSRDSVHKMDYGKIIVQEGKLYESTEHVDDQEHVSETKEEILKQLINNENNELEIVTDFTNNGLLEETILISSENASLISEGKRNSQSLVDGDQFISSNMFYFGTENCRDVSVHVIDSLDDHEVNNNPRNNATVHSIKNNDSFVSTKFVKNFENILESVDESSLNSESLTTQDKVDFGTNSNTNPLHEFQRPLSETYEYINNNNNIYTSNKKIFDKKLIDSTEDNENMPSDYDKANTLQIIDNNASKISQSVSISDQAETLNTSNKHVFHETILDMKFDVSAKIQSMSEINNCSENSLNQSIEFVNVDEVLEAQAYEYDADNSCPESIDQDELLNLTKCENDQILLDHENNSTSIIKEGIHCTKPFDYLNSLIQTDAEETTQCSRDSVHKMDYGKIIVQEGKLYESTEHVDDQEHVSETKEEILKQLINNENNELEIVTDFTNNGLLEETILISSENASLISEGKRSLSLNSCNARQILESSNDGPEDLDDSLLFKPSDRDLVRYGIECKENEKSISHNKSYKEIMPQYRSPCLKLNEISKSTNNLMGSSYAKDYEDNVIDFYDCDLSSIENSDVEDNLLSSFEKDTSIDNCIFYENQNKLKNVTNSIRNEQTSDNNLKIQNIGSSESYNNSTSVVEPPVSLIHSTSHDHQNNKIVSTSMSMKQIQINPDTDDKLESLNHSSVKINTFNEIPSFNDSNNVNILQSNNFCVDQAKLKSNFNEDQNLEDSIKDHKQKNKNELILGYNTHQNTKISQKSCTDNGTECSKMSSMKINGNSTISKLNNEEEIAKTNTVQSTSSDISHDNLNSEIDKKKYIDEIIKNEQLFNEIDEKLDVNESIISPYITQSLAKPTNFKSALSKKAASNINIHDMGDKALSTYLTQQTMTLDVLEVLHKSLDTCPSSGVSLEDPEGLVVPLMPHQKHAIAWLIWRESQEPHGGILADDMGLGKTLSMISLILKLKEKPPKNSLPVVSIDNRRIDVIIGGTLVVCPASLINQWETEVKTKLKPGLLKVGQYYGVNRNFSALELAENDLVITSYHVVMWDYKIRQNTSPLYKIKWNRVILDEGHNIRNHKTQTSVAVCNIKSLNRWAITGTPIHNKEADFFTLLKFIRCKPFDDWPVWKRWVGNNDDAGKHRLSLLVKTLMLRRTKTELTQFTTFNLPPKEIITIEIELTTEERNAYEQLLTFSSNFFATYLYDRAAKEKLFDPSTQVQCKVQYFQEQSKDKEIALKDHPELLKLFKKFKNIEEIQTYHILVLLLRLQQMCCHPILIKGPITEESIKKEDIMESIPEDCIDVTFNDSYDENTDIDTSPNNIDLSELMSCLTLEDEPVKKKSVVNIFKKSWISSKIEKICNLINQKVLINGNKDKAIIVSQWPSFLYLIYKHLVPYNAKIEMFSGAIPISKRNKIIHEFNNPNGGPQILLLSLKAGGVGLNLMSANHMFLIDVHWNPQLEAQACDRIYRVGQTKPVYLYKFVCANTIETRIINIQCNKLKIAENLFKGTSSVSSKLTIDDLKQIFQFH